MNVKKYDVTALGEILIDFVPDGKDGNGDCRFLRKAGGAPLNFLAAANAYGCKTAFIGAVGNDIHGKFLLETVKKSGISDEYIKTDFLHNTTLAFVELNNGGERDFSFYRTFGADRFISVNDIPENIFSDTSVFHFGSLSLTDEPSREATEYAVKAAKENGCVVTYDPNYRAPLWSSAEQAKKYMSYLTEYTDILKCSVEELELITGCRDIYDGAGSLKAEGVKIVLVTDGENGSYVSFEDSFFRVNAEKVNPVDTTGAGDIFFGSFISKFIKSKKALPDVTLDDIIDFVTFATKVAGLSTEKYGAIASIPRGII